MSFVLKVWDSSRVRKEIILIKPDDDIAMKGTKMECFSCHLPVRSIKQLFSHFRCEHGFTSSGTEVKCAVLNCPRVFLSLCMLKKHILSQHADIFTTYADMTSCDKLQESSNCCEIDMESAVDADDPSSVEMEINLQNAFMTFVTMLSSKANITTANIQLVVENIFGFIDDIQQYAENVLNKLCVEVGIDTLHSSAQSALLKIRDIGESVSSLNSVFKRTKWLTEKGYFISPVEIQLGAREEQRCRKGKYLSVTVGDTCQFIQLKQLLPRLLESENFVALANEHRDVSINERICRDFFNTQTFKQHPFLSSHPNAFILNLFVDAYETVNPLGSHTSVHKLEGLYCTFGNMPPEKSSKTSSIFQLGLWYAEDAKKYGYDAILQSVVNELKELESDRGMEVIVSGHSVQIHALLGFFSADNLGANSLFGFMESFSANRCCRFCLAEKSELQTKFLATQFVRRTRENYEMCASNVDDANYKASESGIKRGCLLNSLKYFHCTEQSIVDCMHDLLEGIIPLEITLVVGSLIERKVCTLQMINDAIRHFDYSLADQNSKPPVLTLPNFHATASETWCLLRNLPLMIGAHIDRDDEHWQLLILLLDCINIIFSPAVTDGMVDHLTNLIKDHHTLFKQLYPDRNLLPKHHFLIHYPEQMKKFGPLTRFWCMRFEAKHRFGKELAGVVRNFQNICKTVATRAQLNLAYNLLSNTLFTAVDYVGSWNAEIVGCLDENVVTVLHEKFGLGSRDEVHTSSSIKVGHYELKLGCVVIVDVIDSQPQFGEILLLVSVGGVSYVVYSGLKTICFDEHFYSYNVINCDEKVEIIAASMLKDYHPLSKHVVVHRQMRQYYTYIATRYIIVQ